MSSNNSIESEIYSLVCSLEKLQLLPQQSDKIDHITNAIVDRIASKLEIITTTITTTEEEIKESKPKRELCKEGVDIKFSIWTELNHHDFPDTNKLPCKRNGIYELGIGLQYKNTPHMDRLTICVPLYVGKTKDLRRRLLEHQRSVKPMLDEYKQKGYVLWARWHETETIKQAEEIEDRLLTEYDYACNEDRHLRHPKGRGFAQTYMYPVLGQANIKPILLTQSHQYKELQEIVSKS